MLTVIFNGVGKPTLWKNDKQVGWVDHVDLSEENSLGTRSHRICCREGSLMSTAKFRVRGQLDGAGGPKDGTVEINRETGVLTVRPLHSRTAYEVPLNDVATWVCRQHQFAIVRAEKKERG